MNILISQRHSRDKHGEWMDSLENAYINFFSSYGFNLFPVSNVIDDIDVLFEVCQPDGIVLTGGGDVDPALFNESRTNNMSISEKRDRIETKLLDTATQQQIPVLGICRGMQFINVYFGGRLIGDINAIDIHRNHTTPSNHKISIIEPRLFNEAGRDEFEVNSYHNQGIRSNMLADPLISFAVFEDLGIVEGFYHTKHNIIGIQWHPERDNSPLSLDKVLMSAFMNRTIFWS